MAVKGIKGVLKVVIRCPSCNQNVQLMAGYILRHMVVRDDKNDICNASETPFYINCDCG